MGRVVPVEEGSTCKGPATGKSWKVVHWPECHTQGRRAPSETELQA